MSRQKGPSSFAVLNGLPTITTALRVKPSLEQNSKRKRLVPVRGQQASYVFDCVLDAATQQQAYQQLCAPLVDGLLSGESSVLLTYGGSQTGKSFTLQGGNSSQDAGVVVQAVQALVRGLSIVPQEKYRLSASFCGLGVGHAAQVVDLLAAGPGTAASHGSATAAMAVLSSWTIEEPADVLEVLKCRRLVQSSANGTVKRAMHTMLTLQLDSYDAGRNISSSKHLSFVELAAPEPKDPLGMGRSAENANARSLAMTYNSLSKVLLALRNSAPATAAVPGPTGAAAAALAAGSQTGLQQLQHLPWRDSTLTRWLQERLHTADTITLVGTVSAVAEVAADTLATISWVSRFSTASKSGAGGVLVSFAWDVAADPEALGSYLRFTPDEQVIRDTDLDRSWLIRQRHQRPGSPRRQRPHTPAGGSCMVPACSSPMVNQCSPNLPGSAAPPSAASVSNAVRAESRWQQQLLQRHQQQSPDSTPMKRQLEQWQQQQERLQSRAEAAGRASPNRDAGRAAAAMGSADDTDPTLDNGRALADEVVKYGELMTALRRAGGGLRAETILEQLLQELGTARAALTAAHGEVKGLRADLAELEMQHADCDQTKGLLQDHNKDLQQQLQTVQKSFAEAAADRDLFLKRLQQLEADADSDGSGRPPSRLELQRQKAHAAQLRLMEAELNALASSNQQLRSQLEMATQQLSRSKVVAQSAADNTDSLQQEVDVLRTAADIEGEIRSELEASVEQLQRACEATARELSAVTADKVSLQQQLTQSHDSVDALAAELQETLAKVDDKDTQLQALAEQLEDEQNQHNAAAQQLSALQTQVSALEEMTQQLQQQQMDAADGESLQQQTVQGMQRILEDLSAVLADFEQDLDAAIPERWKQLMPLLHASGSHPGSAASDNGSTASSKLRRRMLQLSSGGGSRNSSNMGYRRSGIASETGSIDAMMPYNWAHKLQVVLEVLHVAADERTHAADEMQGSIRRTELLERNVEELRKLVATQEDLQQQLAEQLTASQRETDAAAAQRAEAQQRLQTQLDEAQTAVSALADELQECQATLKASQDNVAERDQALDVLADEFVELTTAHDKLEYSNKELDEQVLALAAELEEALLQLSVRDQILDQIWGQLKGLPQHTSTNTGSDMPAPGSAGSYIDQEDFGPAGLSQPKSAALEKLHRQQSEHQRQRVQQRRHSILDGGAAAGSAAAGLAQQAVLSARRRSSAGGAEEQQQQQQQDVRMRSVARRSLETSSGGSQRTTQLQRTSHSQQHVQQQRSQRNSKQDSQQVQPMVVAAVQRLRSQVVDLQQQLADAEAGNLQSSRLQQQLKELRQQYSQLQDTSEQQEQDIVMLQGKCRQLGQQLRAKELENDQERERCQELVATLKQVQQHLQQQQQQQASPPAPTTPSLVQQQAELQLVDCRHQLADTQARLAETAAALAAEKAARLAAEDSEAGRQQLLMRLGALQDELSGLHAQLLDERKQVAALREELALMKTSRDTWRDSSKRAEAATSSAEALAESKTTELTRARAEVHTLKQQLANTAQQLEIQQLQNVAHENSQQGFSDSLAEGLAARLAAAQVMRREAEERAADLEKQLAAAEKRLHEMQQEHGDAEEQLAGKLSVQEAQLVRSKADAAAHRAAAEGAAGQLAEVTRQLAAAQADRDRLQQQLLALQGQGSGSVLLQPTSRQQPQYPQQQPQQQRVSQLLQQPGLESAQPWNTLGAPVSYETLMASASPAAAVLQPLEQVVLQQPWPQAPQIASSNPFYQPSNEPVAAPGRLSAPQAVPIPQQKDFEHSYSGAVGSGSPGTNFLGGLFSGWRSKSSPGKVGTVASGVGTPVHANGSQQRMAYSASGGGSASPADVAVGFDSSALGPPAVAGSGIGGAAGAWGAANGPSHHGSQAGQDAESPCLY